MQKDLVLKMAELLCSNDIADGRAKYWIQLHGTLVFPMRAHTRNKVTRNFVWQSTYNKKENVSPTKQAQQVKLQLPSETLSLLSEKPPF